jgi:hypothetical protein
MDLPLEKPDFRALAGKLEGSRDIAQLFCALLRSVGVEARLVCSYSLFPSRPLSRILPRRSPSRISLLQNSTIYRHQRRGQWCRCQHHVAPFGPTSSSTIDGMAPLVPRRPRRLGQPTFALGSDDNLGKPPPRRGTLYPPDHVLHLTNATQNLNENVSKNHHTRWFGWKPSIRPCKNGFLSIHL